jgi:hypothetical protein
MSFLDGFCVMLGLGGVIFFSVRGAIESAHRRNKGSRIG